MTTFNPRDEVPLRIEGVTKRFGDFTAVSDVSLEIKPGEIFALLGPNGAGKTTLISCVTGMANQTEGEIRVFGYDTRKDFRATRSLTGLVPQEINFDPFFTPFESVAIQMGLMGVPKDDEWVDELLRMMSLQDKRDAYTRQLSGGMKRRLLIAKALVHRPKLLFLDEPTAGVDVELRKDLWERVEGLRREGTTVILTTHYLEEAERLADRIGVIREGKLLLVEERDSLMGRYGGQRAVLRLVDPISSPPAGLSDALANATTFEGRHAEVEFSEPEELPTILSAFADFGVCDIRVERTSLEDIFIDLINDDTSNMREAADA